ncbi:unnamed protein product, partial [marine sediment metagenome]
LSNSVNQVRASYLQMVEKFSGRQLAEYGFLPNNLVSFMMQMLSPTIEETLLNLDSGIGSILSGVLSYLEDYFQA